MLTLGKVTVSHLKVSSAVIFCFFSAAEEETGEESTFAGDRLFSAVEQSFSSAFSAPVSSMIWYAGLSQNKLCVFMITLVTQYNGVAH